MPINEINTNSYSPNKSSATNKFLLDSIVSPQFVAPSNGLNAYDKGNFRSIDADAFIWQGFEELALYYASSSERIIDTQDEGEVDSITSSASPSSYLVANDSNIIQNDQALPESPVLHAEVSATANPMTNTTTTTTPNQKGMDAIGSGYFLTPSGDESFVPETLPIAGVSSWGWL